MVLPVADPLILTFAPLGNLHGASLLFRPFSHHVTLVATDEALFVH